MVLLLSYVVCFVVPIFWIDLEITPLEGDVPKNRTRSTTKALIYLGARVPVIQVQLSFIIKTMVPCPSTCTYE
jgi:hypothetical protein